MELEIIRVDDIPEGRLQSKSVAIDTETTGLNIFRDRLCVVQLCFGDGQCYVIKINNSEECKNLKRLLSDDTIQKIFHFARFDVSMLDKFFNIKIKNIFCTKIASKIIRTYTNKHGLKDLCAELLGVALSKEEQTSYWGADKLRDEQIKYAALDVFYLHRLKHILCNMMVLEGKESIVYSCFDALLNIINLDLNHYDFAEIFHH